MTDELAEVESPQNKTAEIADASTEDIRTALGLTPKPEATPEESAPEGEVEQPTEGAETEAPAEETLETEEEPLAKRRIRPRTAEDQQVIDLYRSDGFQGSFDDASRIIYGPQHQPQPQQMDAAQAPDPYAREREAAGALQEEIQLLESKVTEAADNLDTGEALQFQRDIMKKELTLQSLKDRHERAVERQKQEHFNTHRDKAVESRDRVLESYPELADGNSVARRQFDDYVSRAQSDPDYASVFDSPKWPEIMAREFASQAPVQAQQLPGQVQAPPQQAPIMGNQAKVLTSGTTAQPANSQPTAQQVVQNLPNLSREDLYTLLGQPDGQRRLI